MKKVIISTLCIILLISVGCSGTDNDAQQPPEPTPEAAPELTPEPTPEVIPEATPEPEEEDEQIEEEDTGEIDIVGLWEFDDEEGDWEVSDSRLFINEDYTFELVLYYSSVHGTLDDTGQEAGTWVSEATSYGREGDPNHIEPINLTFTYDESTGRIIIQLPNIDIPYIYSRID